MIASALSLGVLLLLLLLSARDGPPAEKLAAERFVAAWSRGDYPAMHAELIGSDRRALPVRAFTELYRRAASTATATAFAHGEVGDLRDGVVAVPMAVTTRVFGTVRATLYLRFARTGDETRVNWSRNLVFPGVPMGERLERHTRLPRRADILARDGTPLAQGPDRTSPIDDVAASIVGELGAPPVDTA
ncbi:MAG: NTF2-like N-terminal transpeptidase domain-containing protein, partial [Solirubrobacteraceae bacterium]